MVFQWWSMTIGIARVRHGPGGCYAPRASPTSGYLTAALPRGPGPLENGSVTTAPGDVTVAVADLYHGAMPTLTADEAAELGDRLLDARAPERFRGEVEPVDPVAGHVPGATNVPSTSLLDDSGSFLPDAELLRALGDPAGAYCGSGVTASVVVAALAAVGVDAALFPGSWSQWSGEPGRPIATGG